MPVGWVSYASVPVDSMLPRISSYHLSKSLSDAWPEICIELRGLICLEGDLLHLEHLELGLRAQGVSDLVQDVRGTSLPEGYPTFLTVSDWEENRAHLLSDHLIHKGIGRSRLAE